MRVLLLNTSRNEIQTDKEYLLKGIEMLQKEFQVEVAKDSPEPKMRAEILKQSLERNDVDYIWIVRGGTNTIDLLPFIDFENIKVKVPVIGLSDFTHLALPLIKAGHKVVYGPTFKDWAEKLDKAQQDNILSKLKAKSFDIKNIEVNSIGNNLINYKKVIGGTLLCIYGLQDTNYIPDLSSYDLFIEHHYIPVETEYEMVYWLTSLKLKLEHVKINSLTFGDLAYKLVGDIKANKNDQLDLIIRTFSDVDYPVQVLSNTHYAEVIELG